MIRSILFVASDDGIKQVGGSLNESVSLAKPEPQEHNMPNPPDENTMINTKTGWRTQFNSVTLKEGRSALHPGKYIVSKSGMEHKSEILGWGTPPQSFKTMITQQAI